MVDGLKRVCEWYADRIGKGELAVNGWSRPYSQQLRWDTTFNLIQTVFGDSGALHGKLRVVDFGCGTGDFFFSKSSFISEYIGVEMRRDAFLECQQMASCDPRMTVLNGIPDEFYRRMDVVISNAVHGFAEQDPVEDFRRLDAAFSPRMIVADFFSTLRPYEPDMDGYRAFSPWEFPSLLMQKLGFARFSIDHLMMPHVFTVALVRGKTPWEESEDAESRFDSELVRRKD